MGEEKRGFCIPVFPSRFHAVVISPMVEKQAKSVAKNRHRGIRVCGRYEKIKRPWKI